MKVRKIAIVSLSRGLLGEKAIEHEYALGLKRLKDYGLEVVTTRHALMGIDYLNEHPESRAEDFLEALSDESVDMILCAIGGNDTYRLLPYLFDHEELAKAARPKIFLGFSDTTFNHFMLHKIGFKSFYGQSFIADVCELGPAMLPYSEKYFQELITTGRIAQITPSEVWYKAREDFSKAALGSCLPSYPNEGFRLLQGPACFEGEFLGGCIDSIYDMLTNYTFEDSVRQCEKYALFPKAQDWKGKILLLESSETQAKPEVYRDMVRQLKKHGVLDTVNGIVLAKPYNEKYMEEYYRIFIEELNNPSVPVLANFNIGHSQPRCILPFGVKASVDAKAQTVTFHYDE